MVSQVGRKPPNAVCPHSLLCCDRARGTILPCQRGFGMIFAMNYADDTRLAQLLFSATVLAYLLATFGIYALAAYNVQRRTREIALHKLHVPRRWPFCG